MKNIFYCPKAASQKDAVVKKLMLDLEELKYGEVPELEVTEYVTQLLQQIAPVTRMPNARFLKLEEPEHLSADMRVEWMYKPTYIATAILTCAWLQYTAVRELDGILEAICSMMEASTGRRFAGHGFDGARGMVETMEIFADGNVAGFLKANPHLNPAFETCFADCKKELTRLENQKDDPELALKAELLSERMYLMAQYTKPVEPQRIFVYGTLMQGQRANHKLGSSKCLGRYLLKDHAMYNLGSFPGIVPEAGESVVGEVYEVEESLIPQLDAYEGEGDLYLRKTVTVYRNGKELKAQAYIYNQPVHGRKMREPWNAKETDIVWYAGYGSNLADVRFRCYIKGGENPYTGKTHPGCKDHADWIDEKVCIMPGKVYMGNESRTWGNKGVAFYDPEATGDRAWMHLYKITRDQFHDVQQQEGASPDWYGRIVCLDVLEDGCPVYTLTSETHRPENEPSDAYITLIHNALLELEGKHHEFEIDNYVAGLSKEMNRKIRAKYAQRK